MRQQHSLGRRLPAATPLGPTCGTRLFLRRFLDCRQVTIVTRDATGEVTARNVTVRAVPLWRYLLRE